MALSRHELGRAIIEILKDTIDLSDYLTDKPDGENIRPANFWREQHLELLKHGGAKAHGATLPWVKTHEDVRFRAGEVTLWHGQNYSGKSLITSQTAVDLCGQGFRVCIASLEMSPTNTLDRMAKQAAGGYADPGTVNRFHDWTDDRLWIYDRRGSMQWEKMVAVIRYAVDKFDIQHFFIDSLMKCVRGEDNYNAQKDFVDALCAVAQDLQIHIHLVHHTGKPKDANGVPGRYDAKGSGSISDQVDNCIGVWRNRIENRAPESPDCLLNIDKQRNGEWDGKVALWFDPRSMTYRGDQIGMHQRNYLRKLQVAA